jgi:hypothetical protein
MIERFSFSFSFLSSFNTGYLISSTVLCFLRLMGGGYFVVGGLDSWFYFVDVVNLRVISSSRSFLVVKKAHRDWIDWLAAEDICRFERLFLLCTFVHYMSCRLRVAVVFWA